jgi:enamine deaminase RidA (YjgF/YER057c/UK114 family)
MLERYYVIPRNSYRLGGDNKVNYSPVMVVKGGDHAHVYVSGRVSRRPDGQVACKGDMRGQIRVTCENVKVALECVGATLADVTRTVTYTTDIAAYLSAADERFKFFNEPLPTSSLIGVASLVLPDLLVEIEVEAIIESERVQIDGLTVRAPNAVG